MGSGPWNLRSVSMGCMGMTNKGDTNEETLNGGHRHMGIQVHNSTRYFVISMQPRRIIEIE